MLFFVVLEILNIPSFRGLNICGFPWALLRVSTVLLFWGACFVHALSLPDYGFWGKVCFPGELYSVLATEKYILK